MSDANPSSEMENPTGSVTEQTSAKNPPAEMTEEMVKNHPLYKGLQEENSAKEREALRYKGRLSKVQKDDADENSYVTKEELESTAWDISNRKDLDLYGDEQFQKELDQGIPKDIALKYAKLRHEKAPNSAQVIRQQSMASSGSTSVRDLTNIEITDEDREDMKRWGYSEKSLLKQKALKRARQTV